ncbi:MAG: bifunctional proline dehydrogenase/L-glutamate gamma-semialdehyde dehydrogenase [Actinomycetota bacterium]|nr:bifunctional proline dehydrogenase/L-glutamate gamma-semialdehyde dehydrogenase [Actinomycetota bacterium]
MIDQGRATNSEDADAPPEPSFRDLPGDAGCSDVDPDLARVAEALATRLLVAGTSRRARRERAQGRRIARLLDDDAGLAFVLALTDEVLRIRDPARAARHLRELVAGAGSGRFLGPVDRWLLAAGATMAEAFPHAVVPLVRARVRAELAGFVLPAERRPLSRHIARRRSEGTRLNVNLLGEAVLGEEEAARRLDAVVELLGRPEVDYVSVNISSIAAQIHVESFEAEVERVSARLRRLYDEALRHRPRKFVNLDMEEYRDLELTVACFERVLSEEPYLGLDAGIVLQAYLPDSTRVLSELLPWARERHAERGGTVKVRFVKGANLATERVEAELAGWPQAPFETKAEVDANYKRMLDLALDPSNAGALRIGVASHNLFESAWALTLADSRGLGGMVELEMLEGMVPALAAATGQEAGGLLLYAPVARRADHESVIAYLVRRFDENTDPANFLRHQFSLTPGSPAWEVEAERFRAAVRDHRSPAPPSRRNQDRRQGVGISPGPLAHRPSPSGHHPAGSWHRVGAAIGFANEPDTDFSLAHNREWVAGALAPLAELGLELVPAEVDGEAVGSPLEDGFDPAEPARVAYRWARSTPELVERAVVAARRVGPGWASTSAAERRDLLFGVADRLADARGRLIGVMARDAGKTVAEGDPEVSEAIDFARYYAECSLGLEALAAEGATWRPHGTIAVVAPWNFPLAIPAGGVLAGLAAGNAVILKPAPEAVATARALAEACWSAGVPRDLLQFLPCADDEAGRLLVTHPGVDAVILTGSFDTARMFLGWRPSLRLHAETSGKNAIVVTAAADLDAAVADLVHSAFGHAGQKCSAASLAILEASVYDDPRFRRQLADAVRTLRPGPAHDLRTTMGPLIRPPSGPLADALVRLGPGESWLVEPTQLAGSPNLWSPGVKLGVRGGSAFHLTECFGPVLGLMRAANLDEAIRLQNQPAYGLTAGLHSLDPAEISHWRERVEAGNLYVNRHITGAIVRRQPFGGWKRSVLGPGAKAGGPNYVASLGTWSADFDGGCEQFAAAVRATLEHELAPSDPSGLRAESNVLRYRPLGRVLLRTGPSVPERDLELALGAAGALDVEVTVSSPTPLGPYRSPSRSVVEDRVVVEDDEMLGARLLATPAGSATSEVADKLRFLAPPTDALRLAAIDSGLWVDDLPAVGHPGLEALRWVREQAVSETRHRHGDITGRHKGLLDP